MNCCKTGSLEARQRETRSGVKIKICGIFRNEDVEYVNQAKPDYIGFVFTTSKREVSCAQASRLRQNLSKEIPSVGVFVNSPVEDIIALYQDGVISLAQLHGNEDEAYIERLKNATGGQILVIKVIKSSEIEENAQPVFSSKGADYYLIDSGAGSGKVFDWTLLNHPKLNSIKTEKPWFLAGGVTTDNIEKAISLDPYCIDVSSGAETDGLKDREKIIHLTTLIRKGKTL